MPSKENTKHQVLLLGKSTFSSFKTKKIIKFQKTNYSLKIKSITDLFVLEITQKSYQSNKRKILKLLDAREVKDIDQNSIIICPRRGTESPWASKSKDIFISCGVEDLFNIEKLRLYKTEGVNELNDSELFDPLTEEQIKEIEFIELGYWKQSGKFDGPFYSIEEKLLSLICKMTKKKLSIMVDYHYCSHNVEDFPSNID